MATIKNATVRKNCMVEALKWFSAVIVDKNAPIMVRRIALYYVAHLVGDMHQPVHAGRAGDRRWALIFPSPTEAKQRIFTSFGIPTSWNWKPVPWRKSQSGLLADLTEEERLKWQAGDPTQWTNESLTLRSYASTIPGHRANFRTTMWKKARPIVRIRLAQAGIRLAWLLNNALK